MEGWREGGREERGREREPAAAELEEEAFTGLELGYNVRRVFSHHLYLVFTTR
jgi:hypothetical protein